MSSTVMLGIDLSSEKVSYSWIEDRKILTNSMNNSVGYRTNDLFDNISRLKTLLTVRFISVIENKINYERYETLLVLGTEEFMYPAIRLGEALKRDGAAKTVKVHATTRSPIIASGTEG